VIAMHRFSLAAIGLAFVCGLSAMALSGYAKEVASGGGPLFFGSYLAFRISIILMEADVDSAIDIFLNKKQGADRGNS